MQFEVLGLSIIFNFSHFDIYTVLSRARYGCVFSFLFLISICSYQEASSYKIAVRPERRRQFEKELSSSAEVAFGLLTACLGFEELREQVCVLGFTLCFVCRDCMWVDFISFFRLTLLVLM